MTYFVDDRIMCIFVDWTSQVNNVDRHPLDETKLDSIWKIGGELIVIALKLLKI